MLGWGAGLWHREGGPSIEGWAQSILREPARARGWVGTEGRSNKRACFERAQQKPACARGWTFRSADSAAARSDAAAATSREALARAPPTSATFQRAIYRAAVRNPSHCQGQGAVGNLVDPQHRVATQRGEKPPFCDSGAVFSSSPTADIGGFTGKLRNIYDGILL